MLEHMLEQACAQTKFTASTPVLWRIPGISTEYTTFCGWQYNEKTALEQPSQARLPARARGSGICSPHSGQTSEHKN